MGRNDPCPCGSGKKYKKCCLPKEEAQYRQENSQEEKEWLIWFDNDIKEGQRNLAEVEAPFIPQTDFNKGIFVIHSSPK